MHRILPIAESVRVAGGRALVVGGYVRDHLLGTPSKDIDVEVFGIDGPTLAATLERFGPVRNVGRAFSVFRVQGLDVDFSLPQSSSTSDRERRSRSNPDRDPELDFEAAARRRDLTINAMALDPISGEIIDPHGGRGDLERKCLRATDPDRFGDDPLRGLRVARFIATLGLAPDEPLIELCRSLDLTETAPERIFDELSRCLVEGTTPSRGLEFLRHTALLRFFPELAALVGVAQDHEWHPEGDVWTHTMMVIDAAARLRQQDDDDLALMLGALCHDLGKPASTVQQRGRIRSPSHDVAGIGAYGAPSPPPARSRSARKTRIGASRASSRPRALHRERRPPLRPIGASRASSRPRT